MYVLTIVTVRVFHETAYGAIGSCASIGFPHPARRLNSYYRNIIVGICSYIDSPGNVPAGQALL